MLIDTNRYRQQKQTVVSQTNKQQSTWVQASLASMPLKLN